MKVAITGASGLVGSALVPYLTAGRPRGRAARAARPRDAGRGPLGAGCGARSTLRPSRVWTRSCTSPARTSPRDAGPSRRKARLRDEPGRPDAAARRDARGPAAAAEGARLVLGRRLLRESRRRVARRRRARPSDGFLGRLSVEWEKATEPAAHARASASSACAPASCSAPRERRARRRCCLPFKVGLGGVLGPGTQYMSWIAIDDLLGVVHHALDRPALAGPVNAVAPAPVTNHGVHEDAGPRARPADASPGARLRPPPRRSARWRTPRSSPAPA